MTGLCAGCGRQFESKRSDARFCSSTCRSRALRRRRRDEVATKAALAAAAETESPLVAAVRHQLEGAERLDTVDGQLALLLAVQLSAEDVTRLAALSAELRRTMGRALMPDPGDDPPDEVTRARQARANKRRELGLDR